MTGEELSRIAACGCCEAAARPTPVVIWNRPGLRAIRYRIGTFSSFREVMVRAIASKPELREWTARTNEDHGIALLEMWAYLADILTFYQERIANEAFLGTSTQRDSVERLAALLDYRLAPGAAALAWLAFTTEKNASVNIPPGLRIQSKPAQNEKPQKFETVQSVEAYSGLNKVRVFSEPQAYDALAAGSTRGALQTSEVLPVPGDKLVLFGPPTIRFDGSTNAPLPGSEATLQACASVLLENADLNGEIVGHTRLGLDMEYALSISERMAGAAKDFLVNLGVPAGRLSTIGMGKSHPLCPEGMPGADACNHRVEIMVTGSMDTNTEEKEVGVSEERDGVFYLEWKPTVQSGRGHCFRYSRKFRLFGISAPVNYLEPGVDTSDSTKIHWTQTTETFSRDAADPKNSLDLDGVYDDLKAGTLLLVAIGGTLHHLGVYEIKNVQTISAMRGPLQGAASRVLVDRNIPDFDIRDVTVYELSSPEILFRNYIYPDSISGSSVYLPLPAVDKDKLVRGRSLILEDKSQDPVAVTILSVSEAAHEHVRVQFTPDLSNPLDAATALLYGNVAHSTHGETVADEVLGSGDASAVYQSFTLKRGPVTFVPKAGAPRGVANTLQIRVDGVLWEEKPTLYGHGGEERIYTTRFDEEGRMVVQFGGNGTGAPLPTGRHNVTATYRQGTGLAGRVRARSLSILLDRPVGLKSVVNPGAAQGGGDQETLEEGQRNAPNTVRTFGRIVSLEDFQDAAREYVGVAKARARILRDVQGQIVLLTVAGDGDEPLGVTALQNLMDDLDSRRDPNRRMRVANYEKVYVEIGVRIQTDPAYDSEEIRKKVIAGIKGHFAFANRELGEAVYLSELHGTLNEVKGLVAADMDRLMFKQKPGVTDADFYEDMRRRAVQFVGGNPKPTQPRLLLYPNEMARIEDEETDLVVVVGLEAS